MTTKAPPKTDAGGAASMPIPAILRIPLPAGCEATEEWLRELYQDNPAWRFELGHRGELIINENAGGVSSDIGLEIGAQLRNWCRTIGAGWFRESSGGYKVSDKDGNEALLIPDLSWVTPEQFATVPARDRERTWPLCPAFVVEVLSRNDTVPAQQVRMEHWMRLGATLGWLVDPKTRSVWIYRPGRTPERLARPERISGEDVLVGLEVDFSHVWQMADMIYGS